MSSSIFSQCCISCLVSLYLRPTLALAGVRHGHLDGIQALHSDQGGCHVRVNCATAGLLAIVVPFLLQLSMGEVTESRMLSCWRWE